LSGHIAVVWPHCLCLVTLSFPGHTVSTCHPSIIWSHCCPLVTCRCLVTLSLSVTWLHLVVVSKNKKDKKGTWCGQRYEIDPGLEIPGATLPPSTPTPLPPTRNPIFGCTASLHHISQILGLPDRPAFSIAINSPELSGSPFQDLFGSQLHVYASYLVVGYLSLPCLDLPDPGIPSFASSGATWYSATCPYLVWIYLALG